MTNEEAIKYLKQLYPNGGHCWLDEQRIAAIGMAVKALQKEPANDGFEVEVKKLWEEINTGHSYSIVDSYNMINEFPIRYVHELQHALRLCGIEKEIEL